MRYEFRKYSHKSILRRLNFWEGISSRSENKSNQIELNYQNKQSKTITKIKINSSFKHNKNNPYQKHSLPILELVTDRKNKILSRKKFLNKEKNWYLEI